MDPTFTQKIQTPVSQESCCCSNFTFKKVLAILGFVFVVLVLWQWISSPMVVTVTGTGEVSVPATSATVTTTISVNSDSAQNAINAIKDKSNSIKTVLMNNGVAESDISESQITSYPAGLVTTGATGYQAAIQVDAKTDHVSTIDGLIANLYSAGATLVSQPVLSVENQGELEQQASDAAIKDAKTQISKISWKNLRFIRRKVALYEDEGETTSTTTSKADVVTGSQNQLAVQNGVFKITKTVSVSYKLW